MYQKYQKICGGLFITAAVLFLIGAIAKSAVPMCVAFLLGFVSGVMIIFDKDVRRYDNRKNPITASMASVVGFRKESHRGRYSYSQQYYISFQLPDGQVVELELEEEAYEHIKLGDKALLRYRTWEFLSFDDRDPNSPDILQEDPETYTPSADEIHVEVDWERAEKLLDFLHERATNFGGLIKAKVRTAAAKNQKPPQEEQDSGILTHELDESSGVHL